MEISYTLTDIDQVVQKLWESKGHKKIWAFHAPMGAGKTTLIAKLCKHLGVQDTVSSPTFSIMNEYESNGNIIYHMDWYRLEDEQEAIKAGVEAVMEEADYCFIEWPEKALALLTDNKEVQHFKIDIIDPEHRKIFILD
jgi:tRNA threonylcarbamoyladenosine biosynthesis protein TsaE